MLLKARKKKKEMLIPKSITLKTYSLSVLTGKGEYFSFAKWVTWNGNVTLLQPTWVKLVRENVRKKRKVAMPYEYTEKYMQKYIMNSICNKVFNK